MFIGIDVDRLLRKILCGGLLSTLGILGVIGNIMAIIVFTRPNMNSAGDRILLGKNQLYNRTLLLSSHFRRNLDMVLIESSGMILLKPDILANIDLSNMIDTTNKSLNHTQLVD